MASKVLPGVCGREYQRVREIRGKPLYRVGRLELAVKGLPGARVGEQITGQSAPA